MISDCLELLLPSAFLSVTFLYFSSWLLNDLVVPVEVMRVLLLLQQGSLIHHSLT